MESLVGVLLAGGHGTLRRDKSVSKLLEPTKPNGTTPLLRLPLDCLERGLGLPTYVVVNGTYGNDIRSALSDHSEELFVHQPYRSGAAGAVELVLERINKQGKIYLFKHMVVLYGDMPCWCMNSIKKLAYAHLNNISKPVISMFSVDLGKEGASHASKFGRILYDQDGRLIGVREPYEMTESELRDARIVNPSAWIFDLDWLGSAIQLLKPHDKGDGFPMEYWLPDLPPLATKQGNFVNVLPLEDPFEALGVNTYEELLEVQKYLRERRR